MIQGFKIEIPEHFYRALGQRDQTVVVLVHESPVIALFFPNIKRGVLIFFIRALERHIIEETRVPTGFPGPHPTVRAISRHVFFLDSKKNQVGKHSIAHRSRSCLGKINNFGNLVALIFVLRRIDRDLSHCILTLLFGLLRKDLIGFVLNRVGWV